MANLLYRFAFLPLVIPAMLIGLAASPLSAESGGFPLGNKSIYLKDNSDTEFFIGQVRFAERKNGSITYDLTIDTEKFTDFFLSMKEMKCLEGKEIWCFIPYPYEHPRSVNDTDLRWLEHDLLFMFKTPTEFGANLWNGIYYDMKIEGEAIRGTARAIDLNYISAPPEDLTVPPYSEADIDELEPATRWLPFIEIR